jgi:hypothetical protein
MVRPGQYLNTTSPVRILALLALVLPAIFYILTLSFTLATIYSPSFALSHPATSDGPVTNFTYKASPFYTCTLVEDEVFDPSRNYTCTRLPHATGKSGRQECAATNDGDPQRCQQVVLAAGLFVAGAILSGIAVLAAVLVAALHYKAALAPTKAIGDHGMTTVVADVDAPLVGPLAPTTAIGDHGVTMVDVVAPLVGPLATLLALLAAVCIWLGQDIGVTALVIGGDPQEPVPPEFQTHWFMGPAALVYPSVAYLAAILGVFTAAATNCTRGRDR